MPFNVTEISGTVYLTYTSPADLRKLFSSTLEGVVTQLCRMGAYGSKRFKEDLEALRRNDPTLQVLDYDEASIGDEGARALADALRSNRTLKRLRLGGCGLSALGLQRICRALCDSTVVPCHLRRLDLVRYTRDLSDDAAG